MPCGSIARQLVRAYSHLRIIPSAPRGLRGDCRICRADCVWLGVDMTLTMAAVLA